MANATRNWQRRTAEQWKALLERQAASAQSVEAFCRGESITTASFYRWRTRLSETAGAVEVSGGDSSPSPPFVDLGTLGGGRWELELTLGGGVVLRLRGG